MTPATASPQRVRVQIDRARGVFETFNGTVLAQTTTSCKVAWPRGEEGEWFAKAGPKVQCTLLDEDLNPAVAP